MKKIIKVIVFIILFGLALYFASQAAQNDHLAAVISGILGSAIFALFFEDITNTFKAWLNVPIRIKTLTIFLYGRGGTGKTTFIKSILSAADLTYPTN